MLSPESGPAGAFVTRLLNWSNEGDFHARPQVCPRPPAMLTLSSVPKTARRDVVPAQLEGSGAGFRGGRERFLRQEAGAQRAGVAQLVEHLICNQRVGGSNPFASST